MLEEAAGNDFVRAAPLVSRRHRRTLRAVHKFANGSAGSSRKDECAIAELSRIKSRSTDQRRHARCES